MELHSYFTRHLLHFAFCCECLGYTPLHYAADFGHADVLSVLLNSPDNGINLLVRISNFLVVYSSFCLNIFTKFMICGLDTVVHVHVLMHLAVAGESFLKEWNIYGIIIVHYCTVGLVIAAYL